MATTTSLTPPTPVAGDILVLNVAATHGVSTPTGYTALTPNVSDGITFSSFIRVADGTETSISVVFASALTTFFSLFYCEYPAALHAAPVAMITMGG